MTTDEGLSQNDNGKAVWAKPNTLLAAGRAKATAGILFLLLSIGGGFLGGWLETKHSQQTSQSIANQKIVSTESQIINSIDKTIGPSVVSINVTSQTTSQDLFFGFAQPIQQVSAGTGFIISSDGVIITNRHVLPAGLTSVSITLSDGTKLDNVNVIGRTADNDPLDIAFLKVKDTKGKKLQPAKLGDSTKVQVGDRVIAIGNALGQFQNTVTSGIISGFGRNLQASNSSNGGSESLQDLFQTDAAINEGNSGGPLVNINGEVIGINTAVAGGQAQNIGFAIPINDAQGLIKSVLQQGKLLRPYLGVRYVPLTDDYAYQYNLSVKRGAYIAPSSGQPSIIPGSPAEKAGLKEKDIITKVDATTIDENHSLTSALSSKSVGDIVTLTVVRDGKTIIVKATLAAAPSQ
ncbi:trypsin-like peptidase domain-containing protein [Candidatus Saccharibacteria bacterium]|nr:trypsin-like peptidase domain-containing protein [Candidatus Saccharibacteria bacterium]